LSTRTICGNGARLTDIGARLGADYVLSGNCEVKHERLSVRFELANTRSETVLGFATGK
jgi:TolB-like protein